MDKIVMNEKNVDRKEVEIKAIDTFGKEHQLVKAIEEMSELTKEIAKDIEGNKDVYHIAEEIADVEIMIEQLKYIYSRCDHAFNVIVDRFKEVKIIRLEDTITKELNKRK